MTVTDPSTTTPSSGTTARVVSVHASGVHGFSKPAVDEVVLIEGVGVAGDAHAGVTVQHRSRVAADPSQPNLRQVHLIHAELFDRFAAAGHDVAPGDLGENVTTRGIDLLGLPVGTRLTIGEAVVTVTGLRNPCQQINDFRPGLLKQVLRRRDDGEVERLAGVMGIVSRGGTVRPGDVVDVALPTSPHLPLTRV
ncbi:MOSC domain-containing protein [Krasilnikoviella flava]|uniref:MOSC domain-containing protein YiiM n=1 Tax=Krasilnikoviella flava TaxID=526729 RepID=A0A1T5K4M1_9MICO|nr:MOSC domain-containing protein [Krasilnikoviella flava]SKC58544.1 MOSC domain-containing protein YiiM [Krasilnikoviella flava]